MRVHFVGNTCNHHFDVARSLRELGVDAHLFLPPLERHPQVMPETADPSLRAGYPPWIHLMEIPGARFRHLADISRRARDELADCDLVHAHGNHATWVHGTGTPYVIQPFGFDFSVMPFGRMRAYTTWKDFMPDPRWWGFPRRLRAAYEGARAIILSNVDHLWARGYSALLAGRARIGKIGLVIDTDLFSPRSGDDAPPALVARLHAEGRLVLFQPTRQIWTKAGRRSTGGYSYGNDLFFRGLAQAIRRGARASVVVVDKANQCTEASKRLVRALGIAAHVHWIAPMPRHELVAYYRHADLSVDAFYAGGFGSAALEAMACACPVLMYLDEEGNDALYGEVPPVANARTVEEIGARIVEGAAEPERLRELGARARAFVLRHHARTAVMPKYRALHEAVLGTGTFEFLPPDLFLAIRHPLASS